MLLRLLFILSLVASSQCLASSFEVGEIVLVPSIESVGPVKNQLRFAEVLGFEEGKVKVKVYIMGPPGDKDVKEMLYEPDLIVEMVDSYEAYDGRIYKVGTPIWDMKAERLYRIHTLSKNGFVLLEDYHNGKLSEEGVNISFSWVDMNVDDHREKDARHLLISSEEGGGLNGRNLIGQVVNSLRVDNEIFAHVLYALDGDQFVIIDNNETIVRERKHIGSIVAKYQDFEVGQRIYFNLRKTDRYNQEHEVGVLGDIVSLTDHGLVVVKEHGESKYLGWYSLKKWNAKILIESFKEFEVGQTYYYSGGGRKIYEVQIKYVSSEGDIALEIESGEESKIIWKSYKNARYTLKKTEAEVENFNRVNPLPEGQFNCSGLLK